ncbi:MAG: bifunctional heptose 7-phosphate kinase/heptose 1-phosphate adenyltransferase [Deltaproteobacteria bacterium]
MKINPQRLARIVPRMRGHAIGVLGDYMFDEFLRGEATRISPEAPVPVVLIKDEKAREGFAGGAGNVAVNIRALGGKPIPFGAIGDDETGRRLVALLKQWGIQPRTLAIERGRVTPRKVRVAAHQHQLLRLDFERPAAISERTEDSLGRNLARWMPRLKALTISDYSKGSVSTDLTASAISLARQRRIPVFVDAKADRPEICRHATLLKKNLHEAELIAGHPMRTRNEMEQGGRRLLAELQCSYLLVTRGGEGMTLFDSAGTVHNIPGVVRPVYDVTGAGDTVLAVLALAVAGGASMQEAAWLANRAGGRVVLKFGTAEIQPAELLEALKADDGAE